MSSITLTNTTTFTVMNCPECSGVFALPREWVQNARDVGGFEHCYKCPFCGTSRGWGKGYHEKQIEELQSNLDQARRSTTFWVGRANDAEKEAKHFRKSRDGVKGALAKVKKRIGRGVCPCCNRYFKDLHNHMRAKHPGVQLGDTPEANVKP